MRIPNVIATYFGRSSALCDRRFLPIFFAMTVAPWSLAKPPCFTFHCLLCIWLI